MLSVNYNKYYRVRVKDLLLLSLFVLISVIRAQSTTDRDALNALYRSTNGDKWLNNSNWNTIHPLDEWYGVTVENGKVTKIFLPNNNLSGKLPPEIKKIWNLKRLDLSNNNLENIIPAQIGELSELRTLILANNKLKGAIPKEIGGLTQLTYLNLAQNILSGNIPKEIGSLKHLEDLYLHENYLEGEISPEIGKLTNLKWLNLSDNNLSGQLPKEMGNLVQLTHLFLFNNELGGQIPWEIVSLPKLEIVAHDVNKFSLVAQDKVDIKQELVARDYVLSVTVMGIQNKYQWFKNNVPINGANSSTYKINSSDANIVDIYTCEITHKVFTNFKLYSEPHSLMRILTLPPIISIQDIYLDKNVLNANETAQLSITVKNVGPGDAQDVYAEITGNVPGLIFPSKANFDLIKKDGGTATVSIDIKGGFNLPTGEAQLDIKIIEPNFKVRVQGKRLIFATREFRKPKLIIAKYSIVESNSASPNNRIDLNEIIDVKLALQNIGEGDAENVKVSVNNLQNGVMFLGVGEGNSLNRTMPAFSKIAPGKYETINLRYFVNSDFSDKNLSFNIAVDEKYNLYGLHDEKTVSINTELMEEGFIRTVNAADINENKKIIIEDIPDFEIDIRKDIPTLGITNPDAVAVIIGNKHYRKAGIPTVEYAINDASIMKQYLMKMFGYKEGNIIYLEDASQADMNSVFGTTENYKGQLFNYVKSGKSDVFIYYSGHGAPNPEDKQGYFVPVDCDPSTLSLNGYSLNTLYSNITRIDYKSLTVVIDACFSGTSEKGSLIKNISPVFIEVKNPFLIKNNTTVFTSASGAQTSSWYPDKKHSLFTYYFLKGLKGEADNNHDKNLTIEELKSYVTENVTYMARRLNSREQTPQVIGNKSNNVFIEYEK